MMGALPVQPGSRVLVAAIDTDPDLLAVVSATLESEADVELLVFSDPNEALSAIRRRRPQIVLLDSTMPGVSGMELLEHTVQVDPAIDVILMTPSHTTESAVEVIHKGASDYLNKPLIRQQLSARVAPLIAEARRQRLAQSLDNELLGAYCFEGIIGRSPLMLDVFARLRRVAPYFRTVLITGPTGTGKELVARALHRLSQVSRGPFEVCNCAAVPQELFETTLFGHVRGAFTNATSDKAGLFELANGGVLFLDEIGEMPVAAQAKLLRAVENQEVQRVGSTTTRKVDVRIVCATNRNLPLEIAARNFREDLLFRISMVEIQLPSLAERREDLPLLIRHFINHFAKQYSRNVEGITGRAEAVLLRSNWTGNVRELENVIGYACMMADSSRIDTCDLPPAFSTAATAGKDDTVEMISLAQLEKAHARRVLAAVSGDKVRTAAVLGVSRATLYRLLDKQAATLP